MTCGYTFRDVYLLGNYCFVLRMYRLFQAKTGVDRYFVCESKIFVSPGRMFG